MSLLLIHDLKQQIERKEEHILYLEEQLESIRSDFRLHLQEHESVTKSVIQNEILNELKFNVEYTDFTYGNNTPVQIQVEYGGYLLSKIHLD